MDIPWELLMAGGYGLGGLIGWTLMDKWLNARARKREAQARNVTPGRVA